MVNIQPSETKAINLLIIKQIQHIALDTIVQEHGEIFFQSLPMHISETASCHPTLFAADLFTDLFLLNKLLYI